MNGMSHWSRLIPFVAGWLILFWAGYVLERRGKKAAQHSDPYISPLDGTAERVPAALRANQYFLWAIMAAATAATYFFRREYLGGSPWFANAVVGLYCAWVYRWGREPKIMEGFHDLPDPPSLLRKS
jgi:hypothetical protein